MRVAFYTEAAMVGGAERALGTVLAHLDERFDATVVGIDPGVTRHLASLRPGTPAVVVELVRSKTDLRRLYLLARAFRRIRPDVVHANLTFMTSGKYALPAARLARVPVVAVEHLPTPITNGWQRLVKQCATRLYAAHVTIGQASARTIERALNLRPGSVEVIYNGVEDLRIDPAPRAEVPVVGTVARYVDQKGLDVLLRAAPEVPEARFVLVGDGPERPNLEQLAAELGVTDMVKFTGWCDNTREALGTFDIFALPSRYEGLPLALVDAMLAGIPIVATRVGSIPEAIVDGEQGLLVPPDDPSALAQALKRMLTDRGLCERLGAAARAEATARFTAPAMAREYAELYTRVSRG